MIRVISEATIPCISQIVSQQKGRPVCIRQNSGQLLVPIHCVLATAMGWFGLMREGTIYRTIPIDQFECVGEAAYVDRECSVSVTSSSEANWVFIDLFPVF